MYDPYDYLTYFLLRFGMAYFYKITLLILLFFGFVPLISAQTLAETQLVTAIATELNPAIRLPRGSYRALGAGTGQIIAKVPNAENFSNWEVYTATGVVAALQLAFVQQLFTSFAGAGYFLAEQSEKAVGMEKHTQYIFEDGSSTILLYVISTNQKLTWLVAKG